MTTYTPWRWANENECFATDKIISYDSEFIRERFYQPQLALIQIHQPNDEKARLFDPMANKNMPWQEIYQHPAPIVVHGGHQDLELMKLYGGGLPREVRDTQVGFALFQPKKMASYAELVKYFLHISLKKEATRSNWLVRPLSPQQLNYAADDVGLLSQVYPLLAAKLEDLGRLSWWIEECERLLVEHQKKAPTFVWYQLKGGMQQLRGNEQQRIAAILSAAREKIAEAENRPRRSILSDEEIIALARKMPKSVEDLAETLVPNHILWQELPFLIAAFAGSEPLQLDVPQRGERTSLNTSEKKRYKKIYQLSEQVANELNISIEILSGTSQNLKRWCINPNKESPLLTGWRRDIFTDILGQAG